MLSYHNDPKIKAKYIARFAEHRRLDQVVQGLGFENGKGCFVGCTLDKYDPKSFETELGIPEWLAELADTLFENCPKELAPQFGTDLLEAIPIGVDLEPVRWKLAIWRHTRQLETLKNNTEDYASECRAAIKEVINYCQLRLEGGDRGLEAESAAESAWSAESAAAWSAASQEERDMLLKLIKDLGE